MNFKTASNFISLSRNYPKIQNLLKSHSNFLSDGRVPSSVPPSEDRSQPKSREPLINLFRNSKFGVDTKTLIFLTQKFKFDFSKKGFLRQKEKLTMMGRKMDQMYIAERHQLLGSNLASAHFIVSRGGSIRFEGVNEWVKLKPGERKYNLPGNYVPNLYLESIDTTGVDLLYEGFDNLTNLTHLKTLILNSPYIDDWCLDKLYIYSSSLEHLEIINCPMVTYNGLCTLHKLRKLKTLKLKALKNVAYQQLVSLLIEDSIPGCKVLGLETDSTPI